MAQVTFSMPANAQVGGRGLRMSFDLFFSALLIFLLIGIWYWWWNFVKAETAKTISTLKK